MRALCCRAQMRHSWVDMRTCAVGSEKTWQVSGSRKRVAEFSGHHHREMQDNLAHVCIYVELRMLVCLCLPWQRTSEASQLLAILVTQEHRRHARGGCPSLCTSNAPRGP